MTWSHYWRVHTRLGERFGQTCRVVTRGSMNTILIEFDDGYRVATSRNYVRRLGGTSVSAVALQQRVDEPDGEVVVQFTAEDQSEIDRSHQKLGSNRNVRVLSKITAGDTPLEDPADFVTASLHHGRPEGISQGWIDGDLRK